MITIEIDEYLLPWIINALRSYEDDCIDYDEIADRQMLINDLENLFEDGEYYED
jgi:hypothetical protein